NVAILGLRKLEAGEKTDLQKIEPLYVRRPEAEVHPVRSNPSQADAVRRGGRTSNGVKGEERHRK
ncbi:hypothetical protein LR013_02165, partial [candidate division NPL-UPA2 bacterium]|nr:hypothetical protein [candidate division NPL-UPA2 bacterium]